MSQSQALQHFLARAKEKEKRYDWLTAVEFHKKALSQALKQQDFLKAGDIKERVGCCFHRAAFQAETNTDFKKRMELAGNAYYDAVELFEKVEKKERQAKINHCKAMATYVDSWLVTDLPIKKQQLDKCCRLEKKALAVYKKAEDPVNAGKTYIDSLIFLTSRLDIAWDAESREKIISEALEYGEEAIMIFSKTQEKYSLALAYTLTSTLYRNAVFARSLGPEKRGECRKKALNYAKRAIELSEDTDNAYLIGLSNSCLFEYYLDIAGSTKSSVLFATAEKTLQCGILAKDNFLIAESLCGLEVLTAFSIYEKEDPDKAREVYKKVEEYCEDAIRHYSIIAYGAGIANAYIFKILPCEHLATIEINLKDKRRLIEEAVNLGCKGLEHARLSGQMRWVYFLESILGRILICLIRVETDTDRKRGLLKESSRYIEESLRILKQASACATIEPKEWNFSTHFRSLALTQSELASMEKAGDRKIKLLKKAIKNMRSAHEYWLKWEKSPWAIIDPSFMLRVGERLTLMGEMLRQLFELTNDLNVSGDAVKAFEESIEYYGKVDSPFSRIAENYWKIAQVHNKTGNYSESSDNFELASQNYVLAAKKLPQLKALYQDYASYMLAWNEIEKARHHHAESQYGQAKEHYEQASTLHESTERWNYLSANYYAWARLEEAEHYSREDRTEEAKDFFQKAATLFAEAKKSIRTRLKTIENEDEKELAVKLVKASDTRHQYCFGRIALEEARILDRQGSHAASSMKYGVAVDEFQKIIEALEHESDRQELIPIVDISKAWQMMTKAEAEASPAIYLQASKLFEQAKEHSLDEKAKVLVLGHSVFCKALEAGTRFETTIDMETYSRAKKYLVAAQNYYVKAAFKKAAEYARATQRLLDAYMYMYKAETEIEPMIKRRCYQISEKLLDASAASYMNSKHPEKANQVKRLLEDVKEERKLAKSLSEIFHPPFNTSSTESFGTPSQTREKAVGLERFEDADIQARIALYEEEVTVNEEFDFRLDLVNAGKRAGLLLRIDDLIPQGFQITASPTPYTIENGSADMKGKSLGPFKVESIKLSLQATETGFRKVSPRIIYVNEAGKFRTCKLEPVTITVQPQLTFEFKTKAAKAVFDFLTSAFVKDYMRRRIALEKSGWRTLMEIVKHGKVSKYSLYGNGKRRGRAIFELGRRGLAETRVFPGERGRGGRVLKMRIDYNKETIKRFIDGQIMIIKENKESPSKR